MYLVAIAWMYVVLMMAVAEAMAPQGTVLGAIITFLLYGVLPLAIVMYLLGTPSRRRARRQAMAEESARSAPVEAPISAASPQAPAPDAGGHAAGASVAAERKEA